jgi:hypothetical protein
MKRVIFSTGGLVLAFALATGCASGGNSSDDTGGAAADLSAAASLSGTYDADGANDLAENSLTFNSDHTYVAMGGCPTSGDGPHCFAITRETGKWKTAKSGPQLGAPGGAAQLLLTSDLDGSTKTFFFKLTSDGKDLTLSTVFNGTANHFTKDDGPSNTTSAKDSLVGSWADDADQIAVGFRTLELDGDSTFNAQGGCTAKQGCDVITHQEGTWKLAMSGPQLGAPAGAQELVLTDSFGQTTTLFFKLDSSGKQLSLGKSLVGNQDHFTKK